MTSPVDVADSIQFSFHAGREIMRFEANGNIYVDGRLVENDREIVDGIRRFLVDANRLAVEQANRFSEMANEISSLRAERDAALARERVLREAIAGRLSGARRVLEKSGDEFAEHSVMLLDGILEEARAALPPAQPQPTTGADGRIGVDEPLACCGHTLQQHEMGVHSYCRCSACDRGMR